MNDTKNILLAWVSSATSVFAAIEARTWITIISAIVLPIVFFAVGKTVDVCLQIYFRRRDKDKRSNADLSGRTSVPESAEQTAIHLATGEAKRNL